MAFAPDRFSIRLRDGLLSLIESPFGAALRLSKIPALSDFALSQVLFYPMRPTDRAPTATEDGSRVRELLGRSRLSANYLPGATYSIASADPANIFYGWVWQGADQTKPGPSGVNAYGDGIGRTIVKVAVNTKIGPLAAVQVSDFRLADMTIDGTARQLTADGSATSRNPDGSFNYLQVNADGTPVDSVHGLRLARGERVTLERVHFKNIVGYGFAPQNGQFTAVRVVGNIFEFCGADAIDAKDRTQYDGDPAYTGGKALFASDNFMRHWGLTRNQGDCAMDLRGPWLVSNTYMECEAATNATGIELGIGPVNGSGDFAQAVNIHFDAGGAGKGNRNAYKTGGNLNNTVNLVCRNGLPDTGTGTGGSVSALAYGNDGSLLNASADKMSDVYRDSGTRNTVAFARGTNLLNQGLLMQGANGWAAFTRIVNAPIGISVANTATDTVLMWPQAVNCVQDIVDAGARTVILRSGWSGPLETRAISASVILTSVDQGRLISVTTGSSTIQVNLPTAATLVDRARFRIVKADAGSGAVTIYAGATLVASLTLQKHRVEVEWDAAAAAYVIVGTNVDFTALTLTAGTATHTTPATVKSAAGSGNFAFGSTATTTSERKHQAFSDPGGLVWGWHTTGGGLAGRYGPAGDLRMIFDAARVKVYAVPLSPGADNVAGNSLGDAAQRWPVIYSATGAINTSDAREKLDRDGAPLPDDHTVSPLTKAEIAAARDLGKAIGAYTFKDAVAAKGEAARFHIGITVQRAMAIMAEHGLDPLRYAFICHDTWDAEPGTPEIVEPVLDEAGEPTGETITHPAVPGREAGDRYGFRMDELLAFIARGQEARLAALEVAVEWLGA